MSEELNNEEMIELRKLEIKDGDIIFIDALGTTMKYDTIEKIKTSVKGLIKQELGKDVLVFGSAKYLLSNVTPQKGDVLVVQVPADIMNNHDHISNIARSLDDELGERLKDMGVKIIFLPIGIDLSRADERALGRSGLMKLETVDEILTPMFKALTPDNRAAVLHTIKDKINSIGADDFITTIVNKVVN